MRAGREFSFLVVEYYPLVVGSNPLSMELVMVKSYYLEVRFSHLVVEFYSLMVKSYPP